MHVVYPGSFDPPTSGHLHVIERARVLFDRLTVIVAVNPDKKNWLSMKDRLKLLRECCKNWPHVEVVGGKGLLVDQVREIGANAVLKGIRGQPDLDIEHQMAIVNYHLGAGVETVFLLSHERYAHISSSLVRQIHKLRGDVRPFVPEAALPFLNRRSR